VRDEEVLAAGGGVDVGAGGRVEVYGPVEGAGQHHPAEVVGGHRVAELVGRAAHRDGPAIGAVVAQLGDEDVVPAQGNTGVGAAVRVEVHAALETAGDDDVVGEVGRDGVGDVVVGSADGAGPVVGAGLGEAGDEEVAAAVRAPGVGAGTGVEVHNTAEGAGDDDIAAGVGGEGIGDVVVGAAHRGGPAVGAVSVELRDEEVAAAGGGAQVGADGRVEIDGIAEGAGECDVAGRVGGHAVADVVITAAHRGGPAGGAVGVEHRDEDVAAALRRVLVHAAVGVEVHRVAEGAGDGEAAVGEPGEAVGDVVAAATHRGRPGVGPVGVQARDEDVGAAFGGVDVGAAVRVEVHGPGISAGDEDGAVAVGDDGAGVVVGTAADAGRPAVGRLVVGAHGVRVGLAGGQRRAAEHHARLEFLEDQLAQAVAVG